MLNSIIRTVVPVLAGLLITLALKAGIHLESDAVTSLVTSLVTAAYYVVVRLLERYVSPKLGWLLGMATEPDYKGEHAA